MEPYDEYVKFNCNNNLPTGIDPLFTSWKSPDTGRLHLDILLPNGVMTPIVVEKTITVHELKLLVLQKIFDPNSCSPLTGQLTNSPACYNIFYINQRGTRCKAEDEESTLADLNMKLPYIPFRKVEETKHSTETQRDIGSLIGVNLSEVETMGIEEINDFRWTMKVYASKIWQHRYELMQKDKLNILEYQFPPCISHDNINTEYTDASKQIQLKIKFEKDEVEFPVTDTTLPSEILDEAINSLEIKHDRKNLCLKMYGKEEYLIKEYYLSKYASIQEDISNYGKLCLVVKVIDEVIMKLKPFVKIKTGSQIKRSNTTAFGYSQRRKKDLTVSSLELEDNFKIEIGSLKYVDSFEGLPSDSSPWLRISIFHGNVELVDHIDTNVSDILTGTGDATHKTNNEHSKMLEFNIAVKKLPRNARLCFGIYYKDRRGKNMFIGWANRTIFNFKGVMKKTFSMFFSESSTEKPSHDLLNPYKKTEETNFEVCCCTVASLEVTFFNSFEQILTFPEEWLLDWHSGDTDSDSNPRGRRKTIHYFSEELEKIARRDPLHPLTSGEKQLLRGLQDDCRLHHATLLPRIVDTVDYTCYEEVRRLHALLRRWPLIPFKYALQLLDYAYPDERVHEFAVKCLNVEEDETIEMFFCQLVQALKHQNYYNSALCSFLLERALKNQRLGHKLFWSLRCEISRGNTTCKCAWKLVLILESYLLAAPEHMEVLQNQKQFLLRLKSINDTLLLHETRNPDFLRRSEIFHENIKRFLSSSPPEGFLSVTDPSVRIKDIQFQECGLMKSKKKPQKIFFSNFDADLAMEKPLKSVSFIFKIGDDLRQDCLVMQMLQIMDDMWRRNRLNLQMTTYHVVPTELDKGVLEYVQDRAVTKISRIFHNIREGPFAAFSLMKALEAETVCRIQMSESCRDVTGDLSIWMNKATCAFKQNLILSWLQRHAGDSGHMEKVLENFLMSCSGYTVAMYVLGIGDRHNDNIMIKKNGKLFHIDFGHVMGNFKSKFGVKRERCPMILPSEFVHVIQSGGEKQFLRFRNLCEEAFLVLRNNGCLLVSLLAMTLSSGMPELQSEADLEYMREMLQLNDNITEEAALTHFRKDFNTSLQQSYTVTANWWIHIMSQLGNKSN